MRNVITHEMERVRAAVRSGAVGKRELAREAGIRDTVLIGIEAAGWNPTAQTLSALSAALDRLGFFCLSAGGRGGGHGEAVSCD